MFCFIDVLEILLVSTVFAVFVCLLVVIISVYLDFFQCAGKSLAKPPGGVLLFFVGT